MEIGLREILILIGVVVIGAIIVDGIRRMHHSRRSALGMSLDIGGSVEEDETYGGELPAGGARAIGESEDRLEPSFVGEPLDYDDPLFKDASHQEPSFDAGNFNTGKSAEDENSTGASVSETAQPGVRRPIIRQSVVKRTQAGSIESKRTVNEQSKSAAVQQQEMFDEAAATANSGNVARPARSAAYSKARPVSQTQSYVTGTQAAADADGNRPTTGPLIRPRTETQSRNLGSSPDAAAAELSRSEDIITRDPHPETDMRAVSRSMAEDGLEPALQPKKALREVIIVNIMAKKGCTIEGRDLLQQLVHLGMRHGEMNIFHRHERPHGEGRLMFSVANIVEPGVFDLDRMTQFTTPGVCLFMSLPGPEKSMYAFDMLVDTCRKLSNALDCEMRDENHSVMTQQTIEHYRHRVAEFERMQMSRRTVT